MGSRLSPTAFKMTVPSLEITKPEHALSPFSSEGCVTGCSSGPVTPPRGSRWHVQGGKLRGTGEPGDKTLNPVSPSSEATGGGSLTGEGMQGRPRTQKSVSYSTQMAVRGQPHDRLNWARRSISPNAAFFHDENT